MSNVRIRARSRLILNKSTEHGNDCLWNCTGTSLHQALSIISGHAYVQRPVLAFEDVPCGSTNQLGEQTLDGIALPSKRCLPINAFKLLTYFKCGRRYALLLCLDNPIMQFHPFAKENTPAKRTKYFLAFPAERKSNNYNDMTLLKVSCMPLILLASWNDTVRACTLENDF
eukprot:834413-Amphidinium_carterae.1